MVRSTFLFRWHIFLLHHALWSRIRQICRLRIYLCLLNLSRLRAFWKTCCCVSKGPFCQKIRASLIFARSPQRRRHFWAKHWQKFLLIGPGTKNQHSAMEFPEFDFCAKVYRSANKSLLNWEDQMEKRPVSWPCPRRYSPARTLIDGEKTRIKISCRKSSTPAMRLDVNIANGTTDPKVEFSFT